MIGRRDIMLAAAATPAAASGASAQADSTDMLMLTIFLRHDQSKTVDQINQHLRETGWYHRFPPEGVEVVSWHVLMGIGQVVTLRLPANKLRDVNLAVESAAWGGYRTEFYATYDYLPIWEETRRKAG